MLNEGSGSGELLVLRPRHGVEPRYLHYLTLSKPFVEWATATSYGVKMPRTNWDSLASYRCEMPTLEAQRALANLLDQELGRIDDVIDELLTLMAVVQERSACQQTELALRGLDSATSTRSSGVAWMGEVPAHWRVARLKFEARLESGHTPSRSHPELWVDCDIPWVSLNDVGNLATLEFIYETVNLISQQGLAASSARMLPAGTVVVSRDATIGRCGILGVPMATSQHFANWVCGSALEPRYLWLVFRTAMQQHFNSMTDGATLRTIGMPDMRNLVVPIPPLEEQRTIVERAADIGEEEKDVLVEVRRQLDLLTEHRQALITAGVTEGLNGVQRVA
jgi:type I restriction enzyme S subunit